MIVDRQFSADPMRNKLPTQVGNLLPMVTDHTEAQLLLARNLEFLLEQTRMSVGALHERSGVSLRRLSDIRRGANSTIETIEAIARVFKLTPMDLLSPTLQTEFESRGWISRTSNIYANTSAEGKQIVDSAVAIAEKMVGYKQQ